MKRKAKTAMNYVEVDSDPEQKIDNPIDTQQSSRTHPVPDTEMSSVSVDNTLDDETKEVPEIKSSLPSLKLHIPLSIPCSHLLNLFHQVANQQSFQVIEAEENVATAVSKDYFSFKKIFSKCFPTRKEDDDTMCAIKL